MALIVTPGASNADSYLSLADAAAYFLGNPHAIWVTPSPVPVDAVKEWALRQATIIIDESYEWHGDLADEDQALAWPRINVTDTEDREVDDATIPKFIERATAEIANALISENRQADAESAGIQEVTAGPVKVVFDKFDRKSLVPNWVDLMLAFYARNSANGMNISLERV